MNTERTPRPSGLLRRSVPALAALALTLSLAASGCEEPGITPTTIRKPMPVAELPEPVLKAAQKAIPDVTIKEAFQNLEKGKTLQSYEVRGSNARGKIREVRVSTTGEVLEIE